jgi:hypothetical protein
MDPRPLALASSLALCLACGGDDGGAAGSTGPTGSTGPSTTVGGSTSSSTSSPGSTSGADSTSGSTDGEGSTSGGSTGATGSTGPGTGSSTGDGSTGGTTEGLVFSTFSCTETSIVDAAMVETIDGAFDDAGVPLELVATFTQSGNVDFQVDPALPVAPDDPYYADVMYWEDALTMQGWNVTPPGDPFADRRYFFAPDGAQYVALFSAFYYRVYEAGGNGQFEFECVRL